MAERLFFPFLIFNFIFDESEHGQRFLVLTVNPSWDCFCIFFKGLFLTGQIYITEDKTLRHFDLGCHSERI